MLEKIIVLDDEPLIVSTIDKALGKVGYEVISTSGPGEFLSALAGGADLAIVDLHLGGVDTEALLKEAEALVPGLKIMVISGSPNTVMDKPFLEKPFLLENLRGMVRRLLDEPR